ncbi:P110/LppT family adhesin N-terminal domain [Mesomycoplasma dispar]|uniref:Uncharacterized protein n=1 Tax=Mesomycoplasma dispar TaxID=86660 RepID=A0ABN5DR14_9BACT|nr:P110/LppT family adhesin N-terminal domain [Mesomycoplasma dispar]ATP59424.1 hypothetical protein CSW10_00360 [Mesomycoplasma dispar]
MKKVKLKHIIFSIIGISAIASIGATIPYALSVQTENFNSQLKIFTKDASSAKSLASSTEFNSSEFDKLVTKIKPKEKFAKRLNAYDALNLHFDSVYNFDLNDAVDFSELSKKYPDLLFKLVLPESKSAIEIKQNVLKNLGINVSNATKSINYTTKFDLDFSKQEKSFQFSPENLEAKISLSKLDFLDGKTATETAILFYDSFHKNFSQLKDVTKALNKTFSQFGGISFSLNSDPIFALPPNFEIRPELQAEKLFFNSVNDEKNEVSLKMVLLDKSSQKETNFSLKFVDLPKANQKYGAKFLEIFKKNYQFSNEISKYLARNNTNTAKLFDKTTKLKNLNLSEFSAWFKAKSNANANFLEQIKTLIPNFEPKKVTFSVKKAEKSAENHNLVTVALKVDGNFKNQDQLPAGLKLGENNEYSYNFEFNFDTTESIYSGYFRNAIETFDTKTAENLENLSFEIKKDLPVTIFASTIDNRIKHLLNKPLDLKNITKTAASLFDFLNFSANRKEVLTPKQAEVSTTLFQDTEENGASQNSESSTLSTNIPKPASSQDAGNYLKTLFENLEKIKFPPNTSLFLSTFFKDKYTLKLEIKTDGITKEELEIEIDKVSKDNNAYKSLVDSVKMHLFLDWRTNVETKSEGEGKDQKQVLTSITAVNNPNLKFEANPEPSEKSKQKVHLDPENQGIYLAEGGISLQNTSKDKKGTENLKLEKGKTLFYAFKPTKLPKQSTLQYFLLKTEDDGNNFSLVIEPELFLEERFKKIGADFEEKSKKPNNRFINFNNDKKGLQKTYNGEYKLELNLQNGFPPQPSLELKSKNRLNAWHDFLNDTNATIILTANIVEENGKSFLNLNFYTSEYKKATESRFDWKLEIPSNIKWDFSKNLTLGTTKSENQEKMDKTLTRSSTGITFKGFALFEKPKTTQEYNDVFEKFRKQYIE